MKRTSRLFASKEESKYYNEIEKEKYLEYLKIHPEKSVGSLLLDSSLNIATTLKFYDVKIIDCGEYQQIYYYKKRKSKKVEKEEKKIDANYLYKSENLSRKDDQQLIEYKNILRSKFNLQRLVKCNEDIFKTFITLTFAENVTDIKKANRIFANWRTRIQKKMLKEYKKDFLYVCVPEFQKRGAVHYHLLTNLDVKENPTIIIPQENKQNCYDVVFWDFGFTSTFKLEKSGVVGYITKYMTKDIDDRLYTHNRYLASKKLKYPVESYVDLENSYQWIWYMQKICNSKVTYENTYFDKEENEIHFVEYKIEKENLNE